jgi:hypothetical protein
MSTRKNISKPVNRRSTYKTFKKLQDKPKKAIGKYYSIEKVKIVADNPNLEGDIIKEYKNGKLQSQVFITKSKLEEYLSNTHKSNGGQKSNGGKKSNQAVQQPNTVYVQDQTTFGQNLKSGFGVGIGFELASALVGSLFQDE